MISLVLLKQLEDLSDEQVIRRWVDIPYWQYLSGETHFQWKPPAASSDLTHFRKRIGKKGAERLLKLSIELFNPKIQKEEVVIDTTVQEKNITYPTDSKLAKKVSVVPWFINWSARSLKNKSVLMPKPCWMP